MSATRLVDVYPNHFDISVTQSSTDAFVSGEIATGLEGISAAGLMQDNKSAPKTMVCVELLGLYVVEPIMDGDGQRFFWSLDTIDGTDVSSLTDYGHIRGRDVQQNGAAGEREACRQLDIDLTHGGLGFLCAAPKLHWRVDTSNMGSALTFYMRIFYRYVKISFFEFYQLQQSQLQRA